MKRLLCLLALAAAPLLAEQWPVSDAQLGAPRGHRDHPRIAAGANGFLAAWSDSRFTHDVWGTRFDASGRALDRVHVAADADLLALASDGDGYLAVVAPTDCSGIDAVHVDRDGVVDAAAHIADALACPLIASVASNGSSYLAVYTGVNDARTRYVLFDGDGNRLRGPLPINIPQRGALTVGSDGRDYLLAAATSFDVTAYPLSANGDAGAPVKIDASFATDLALAWSGANYLLLATGVNVRTRLLAGDGTPAGATHALQSPQTFNARLTWTGSGFLASWTTFFRPFTTMLTVARAAADGTLLDARAVTNSPPESQAPFDLASAHGVTVAVRETIDQQIDAATIAAGDVDAGTIPAGELVSLSATPQLRPRIAALPSGAAIAWNDDGHLYARLLDNSGHPFGAIVEAGNAGSIAHHIAFDGTNVVVATLHGDSHTIFAQRFTTSLQPVDAHPLTIALTGTATELALAGANGASLFAWTDGTLSAALLAGAPLPQHAIATDNDRNPPAATWDGLAFVVAYSTGTALAAARVDGSGNAAGAPRAIAKIDSPAARSAIAPAGGGVFGAWSNFGIAARIFGAWSDLDGDAKAVLLSPAGVIEGPFLAGGDVVGWTLRVEGGLQVQWRGGGDAAGPAGGDAGFTVEARLGALEPSLAVIGGNVFAAYEHFDEAAGGVPRIYMHPAPMPRHRAARR